MFRKMCEILLMDKRSQFAIFLDSEIDRRNLSQEAIAAILDISPRKLWGWLNTGPGPSVLEEAGVRALLGYPVAVPTALLRPPDLIPPPVLPVVDLSAARGEVGAAKRAAGSKDRPATAAAGGSKKLHVRRT